MYIHKFPSGPFQTNAILIGCTETKKGAVIDPSLDSAGPILQMAAKHGLTLEKILLTHSHWDHFADAHKFNLPIYIHPLDAHNLEKPGSDGLPFPIPIHPVKATHFLKEGEIVSVGNLKLEVIHTPGHSPGGVCFYLREQKLLIAGDTLFKGGIGNLSLPTAQSELMWQSLAKLAKLPPETRVISGHGPETTIGNEHLK